MVGARQDPSLRSRAIADRGGRARTRVGGFVLADDPRPRSARHKPWAALLARPRPDPDGLGVPRTGSTALTPPHVSTGPGNIGHRPSGGHGRVVGGWAPRFRGPRSRFRVCSDGHRLRTGPPPPGPSRRPPASSRPAIGTVRVTPRFRTPLETRAVGLKPGSAGSAPRRPRSPGPPASPMIRSRGAEGLGEAGSPAAPSIHPRDLDHRLRGRTTRRQLVGNASYRASPAHGLHELAVHAPGRPAVVEVARPSPAGTGHICQTSAAIPDTEPVRNLRGVALCAHVGHDRGRLGRVSRSSRRSLSTSRAADQHSGHVGTDAPDQRLQPRSPPAHPAGREPDRVQAGHAAGPP
jgi:hypothetical protein